MLEESQSLSFADDDSKNPPVSGLLDGLIRRFSRAAYMLLVLALYVCAAAILGLALTPAVIFVASIHRFTAALSVWVYLPSLAFAIALGFFIFAFALLAVVPVFNRILPTRLRPFKGGYYTFAALPWFVHNALFYLVRFTVLPFFTLTPFGVWFLKAMGMKIGRHAFINTEYLSDPCMLTIGDDVAVGGSVRIFAHYGGGGNLVIAPTIIGHRVTLGLGVTVMGDVIIGEGATILPHAAVMPKSRVGKGETWGGVPAKPVSRAEMDAFKKMTQGGS